MSKNCSKNFFEELTILNKFQNKNFYYEDTYKNLFKKNVFDIFSLRKIRLEIDKLKDYRKVKTILTKKNEYI